MVTSEVVERQANNRQAELARIMADEKVRARVRSEAGRDIWYTDAPGNQVAVIDVQGETQLRTIGAMMAEAEQALRRVFRAEVETEKREAEALRNSFEVDGRRVALLAPCQSLSVGRAFVGIHTSEHGAFLAFGSDNRAEQQALRRRWPNADFPECLWTGSKWAPNTLHTSQPIPLVEVEKRLTKAERAAIDALPPHLRGRAALSLEANRLVGLVQAAVPKPRATEPETVVPTPETAPNTGPPYPFANR